MLYRQIRVYHTHIEVEPYEKGECRGLEDMYSVFDPIFYKMTPVAYTILDDVLYLPRGTSIQYLEKIFHTSAMIIKEHDPIKSVKMKGLLEPKSKAQEEAIDFLCSEGRFSKGAEMSQLSLNLPTSFGKTIATILALTKAYKCRAIIIVHKTALKAQWRKEILKASNIPDDRIVDITGTSGIESIMYKHTEGDIYLVNHQTIHQYGRTKGWHEVHEFFKCLKVGVKIFDEAHKYFNNILMIDFFSNTRKTFYLTATFTRTDIKEKIMFKKVFSNTYRFGEETINYKEVRRHVNYYYVTFNSHPEYQNLVYMKNQFSISSYKYIDYALKQDDNNTTLKVLDIVLRKVSNLRGKIIITTPKIESSEIVAEHIRMNYPTKKVAVINSAQNKEDNEENRNADIISSTVKSLGTGDDIKGLRVLINIEPFTSETNTKQLMGRLREFSKEDETYMFDIVDTGIPDIERMGNARKGIMRHYAKEIKIVNLS